MGPPPEGTEPLTDVGKPRRTLDDRYELIERIGIGGMAEVWKARDLRLEREIAIKLLPAAAQSEARRRKIEREARTLAATSHPNIVAVYDYGEAMGDAGDCVPYLVMELVNGPDLHTYLGDRGPLPAPEARELIGGVLAAVAHAHSAGVVHGDLKPANVFMGPHGPKVGDFGVARILGEETGNTTIAATPSFAAPEVLRGERATPGSDVYSTACLAFQVLAAQPPFEGANAWDVAAKHLEAPVPKLRRLRSDVPPDLESSIERGMDKNPKRRFADAAAFAAAIGAARVPAASATVPVAPAVAPAASAGPDATEALTRPRPDAARIALLGPLAGVWDRISDRAQKMRESPDRRMLLLLLIPLLLLVAFLAMRDTGPGMKAVPNVVGERYQDAVGKLRLAGFKTDVAFRPTGVRQAGRVLETVPGPKDEVVAGSEVHVIAGALARTPAPTMQNAPERDKDEDEEAGDREGGEERGKRKGRKDD